LSAHSFSALNFKETEFILAEIACIPLKDIQLCNYPQ